MSKILVTGAGGMVGHYVQQCFNFHELVLTDIVPNYRHLDVAQKNEVEQILQETNPDTILHLAAATDVDRCETDQTYAYKSNVVGTQNLVIAARQQNLTFIFLSTSAIFNGIQMTPYIENDTAQPVNYYAKTKLEGEHFIQEHLKNYFIIRAGWMIGGGKIRDKKFVGKIIEKIQLGEKEIFAVNDKYGSPTYAKDLVHTIERLIQTKYYGVYHAANGFGCTRYDIANEIKNVLGKKEVSVHPVSSDAFPLPAPRGKSEQIQNKALKERGVDFMRPWQIALRDYILNDYLNPSNKNKNNL